MRIFFLFLWFSLGCIVQAQNRCATVDYLRAKANAFNTIKSNVSANGSLRGSQFSQRSISETDIIHIPVVVHILYSNPLQNISDAQILSGIDALNRDFRRKAADTVNTPQRFKALAADAQIEFSLATSDPIGRKTNGILRKQVSRYGWAADDKMKKASEGGDDGWDSKSYLNIWIVNLVGGSGYATVPAGSVDIDGVVINYEVFGTNLSVPFNLGRTAVHEVGHWLGLKHIWGDAQCGDDGIDDTPRQGFFTKGCPSGFRSSCNNGEAGDMYMNFMDYTDDACMNLFTKGQRNVMRSQFLEGGQRTSLLKSRGLSQPWINEAALPTPFASIYPNPAKEKITAQLSTSMVGTKLNIYNSQGQLQKTQLVNSTQQVILLNNLKPGVYFIRTAGSVERFIKL